MNQASSDSIHCPNSLGNPASVLPFLTAQANSVFSIASGKEASLLDRDPSTPSTYESQNSAELQCPGVTAALDLGNGWKVVGLTSLNDLETPTASAVQQQYQLTTNVCGGFRPAETSAATLNSLCPSSSDLNIKGHVMNTCTPISSPSNSGEWKVVGITSLNSSCTNEASCVKHDFSSADTGNLDRTSHDLNLQSSSSFVDKSSCSGSVKIQDSGCLAVAKTKYSDRTHLPSLADVVKTAYSETHLPSLADVVTGICNWKIAGIMALPTSTIAVTASGPKQDSLLPGNTLNSAAAQSVPLTTDWKIVGVTSLNSSSAHPSPAITSPLAPVPVVMAAPTPLVAMSLPPVLVASDDGWKVVGVVPLSQTGELPLSCYSVNQVAKEPLHSDCSESEEGQDSTWASNLLHQALNSATKLPIPTDENQVNTSNKRTAHKSWVSSRLTRNAHNRMLLSHHSESANHPLAFLKNCSSQFRNAVLKKNTVSTMLELKRTFQTLNEEDKVTFLGKKKMFAIGKRNKQRAFPGDRLVTESVSKDGGRMPVFDSKHHSQASNEGCKTSTCSSSANKKILPARQKANVETDNRTILTNAFRDQIEAESDCEPASVKSFYSFSNSKAPSQDHKQSTVSEIAAGQVSVSMSDCLQVIKAVDVEGQRTMNVAGLDGDNVNITSVDPWGVCTAEDFGEIAEMMSEKGENSVSRSYSSSRKRKLTTPRKMVQ